MVSRMFDLHPMSKIAELGLALLILVIPPLTMCLRVGKQESCMPLVDMNDSQRDSVNDLGYRRG